MSTKRSPEKERSAERREKQLGVALRANLRRRKARAGGAAAEQQTTPVASSSIQAEPADEPKQSPPRSL